MITPDEAAALCGVSTRMIYHRLEDATVHFIETSEGQLFICLKTLVANTKGCLLPPAAKLDIAGQRKQNQQAGEVT